MPGDHDPADLAARGQLRVEDPSARLEILKIARQKAARSSLNASRIAQGGNNLGVIIGVVTADMTGSGT